MTEPAAPHATTLPPASANGSATVRSAPPPAEDPHQWRAHRADHPAAHDHAARPAPPAARPGHARQVGATTVLATAERHAATSPAPPSRPRLQLQPDLSARTLLDGGWWPRSADPAAELPGLVLAIEERHGPVTRIMLGGAGWDGRRPRRLRVDGPAGSRVVRLGWFETMPAGLLIATARAGRTDLLTIPPRTREPEAWAAMEQAAQAGNRTRTPALLAAITTGGPPADTTPDSIQLSTWEWEGGQHSGPRPPGTRLAAAASR